MNFSLLGRLLRSQKNRLQPLLYLLLVLCCCGALSTNSHAATFAVTYTDSAGEGFYDASLGSARRNAFQASLSYWATKLGASPVPINVSASFDSLGGSSSGAVLGQAGPKASFYNFTSTNSKYQANTFYGSALANHLAGRDLDPSNPEIVAQFNSDVDNATVLGNINFYYGTDSNPGSNVDFYTIALHEVGHGLNFSGLTRSDGSYGGGTIPGIYDRYLTLGNGASRTRLTNMAANTDRASAVISNNLYFDGATTVAANSNAPAKIYAPNPYQGGSSVSHLDESTFSSPNPNELMTPQSSGVTHDAGPVGLGVFADMGWALGSAPQVLSITRLDSNPTGNRTVRFQVTFNTPVTGVDTSDFTLTRTGTITGGSITGVVATGSGSTYTVTVTGYSGTTGTLSLNLLDDDSIADAGGGTKLGGAGTGNGNFINGEAYTFSAPTSSGVASILSVNTANDAILSTTPPSTTPTRIASLFNSGAVSFGVTRASDGTIYALASNYSAIMRFAPGSSTGDIITSGNLLAYPFDMVLGTDGQLYVASYNNSGIVKVNPSTGAQTSLTSGGSVAQPRALAFGPDGALYASNASNTNIVRVDATTGAQTIYANLSTFSGWGIAFGPDASLYVSDTSGNRVVKIARDGTQTALTTGITTPRGMAYGGDGFLYVAAGDGASGIIVKINPSTGAQTTVSSGGELNSPGDVFPVPGALPTISISNNPSVSEGNSGTTNLTFTLTRSGDTTVDSLVSVSTASGTATSGSDYVALTNATVTFAAGSTSQTVTVQVKGDTLPEANETLTLNLSNLYGATAGATTTATGTILNDDSGTPSAINISEFRLSGPFGPRDEYIELANMTGSPVSLNGWTLTADTVNVALSGLTLTGQTIPAYGRLLITNSGGYSLGTGSTAYPSTYPTGNTTPSAYATGNVQYTGDIALASSLTLSNGSTVVDSVGDLSSTSGLSPSNQYAFVRRMDGAFPVNTNGQSNDFTLVDTAGTAGPADSYGVATLALGARLGTPGPQNTSSPISRASLTLVPLDPATNQGIVPDGRYPSRGSSLDPFGRLTLRRTITNFSNQTIKQIRFTLVRTTAGASSDKTVADLRAITSVGVSANGSKVVQAIQIEAPTTPTTPSNQLSSSDTGNGGGLNSSWNVGTLPNGGLAPGASMNVEFVFGIVKEGNYNTAIVITVAN